MKPRTDIRATLHQRLKQVERHTHLACYQRQRKVKYALGPLDIQETRGISQVQGDILFVSYHTNVRQRVETVLRSEGYRYDKGFYFSMMSGAVGKPHLPRLMRSA